MDRSGRREVRKQKRRRNILFQGMLVIAGIILVIIICVGELSSLSGRKTENTAVYASEAGLAMTEKESGSSDGEKASSEKQTDSVEESESETKVAEEKSDEEKLDEVFANRYRYPEKILAMLDKNMETLDFVYDYPEKEGCIYAYALEDEDFENGGIPLLIQWDERWGYGKYGDNIVGTSGCGPACMAMVIAGLTGNTRVTPYTMAVYSEEHGYLTDSGDTLWSFITDGGETFGVDGEAISLNEESVTDALREGFPIICSVRAGDFTDSGHFIVLTGYINGKIKVNDPFNYANSEKLWEFDVLQPQIKNLWKMWAVESDEEETETEIASSMP